MRKHPNPHPDVVALEVLKKNGVNVEKLKELITKGVGAEFTTYYYYTILRMHCTGLEGEGIDVNKTCSWVYHNQGKP